MSTIRSSAVAATIVGLALLPAMAACAPRAEDAPRAVNDPDDDAALLGDAYHERIPPETVNDLMQAKLAHTQALLEGMALEDYRQIEHNARALRFLSREANWRVHTSVAYGVMSDRFGDIATALAEAAQAGQMDDVTLEYRNLAASCMECHAYLRHEGLYRDVSGEVTSAARPDRAGDA